MDTGKKRCTAVVLAAGSGRRMHAATAKQFMELAGKPLIWYPLHVVEESAIIDDCILVTGAADISFVCQEIVEKYGLTKVTDVIAGGNERYASVCNAMRYIAEGRQPVPNRDGYVFVHDGARPFLTEEILRNTYEDVRRYGACVAAVPSKDTVKIADEDGFAVTTPDRRLVWNIQTPQVFETELITAAYGELEKECSGRNSRSFHVTDDASVVELFTDHKVKLTFGSYGNIKITTPEDIRTAESFLERQ
ncbi:MAG: 2-C-methyl-D-erythritol 4-phosphate cytidylyltransferase [Lachnospiraceae bacterium]|nr:2-C-methyl-D-erythritol 4-phosphate cytidylyltransferase [Lachnospiraceae bacterium]MCM1241109.1 2-C-methyl-D-erythritol 4-phosphate cytidylyltransferase [Lachnospiraceae bacterium]